MKKVKVNLQPLVSNINLPTVLKTALHPGDQFESLFVATQVGEVLYIGNGITRTFLDIRHRVIQLGSNGGYDERGLVGLAFHPGFSHNGLFYLHYSLAGTEGPGALSNSYKPDPCDPTTLTLKWTNRETQFDHIDTVEEWGLASNGKPEKRRTLLHLRRPFSNHNGVNSLNFSPETGKLVLTTGDGGSGFDPFHLSQDLMEIAGKIIEIDLEKEFIVDPPVVSRFDELPPSLQETLTVMVIGVRNAPGISYQRLNNQYIKYVGQVGQELVESIFSFSNYKPLPVPLVVQGHLKKSEPDQEGLINLGWRGWEGDFPSPILWDCSKNPDLDEKVIAFYNDAVITSAKRLRPLLSYFHQEPRPDKFRGTALTGVQPYMGNIISGLKGSVVFTDFARRKEESKGPTTGVLAYSKVKLDGQPNDFSVIDIDYDFGSEDAYYVSLGTDRNQQRLFLGVNGSSKVTDYNKGTVFEIIP